MGNDIEKMMSIPLNITSSDGESFSIRCMNCGETGRFVTTICGNFICCVKCTCVLADREAQTKTDMSNVGWKL